MSTRGRTGRRRGSSSSKRELAFEAFLELLERKWTLRLLWALHQHEEEAEPGVTFRSLQELLGNPSPTVLNKRITELRDAGILDVGPDGYELAVRGEELEALLLALRSWFEAQQ